MTVFVWNRVDDLTSNYHSQGGLVVFADTLERALELAKAEISDECQLPQPDDERDVVGGEEKVYVFPDAGCC